MENSSGAQPLLLIPVTDIYPSAKEDLTNLLNSIKKGGIDKYCRIIVLLDSVHRIFAYEFQQQWKDYEFLNHNGNRLNFVKNVNRGLRLALEEKVGAFIVNMDCLLPSWEYFQWLGKQEGMAGARTVLPEEGVDPLDFLNRQNSFARNFNMDWPEQYPVQNLPGWKMAGYCYWLAPEVLQEVGVLWEGLYGGYDDDELIARVLLAGFPVIQTNIGVTHLGSHINQLETDSSRSGAYKPSTLGLSLAKFKNRYSVPPEVPDGHIIKWIQDHFVWDKELMYCE